MNSAQPKGNPMNRRSVYRNSSFYPPGPYLLARAVEDPGGDIFSWMGQGLLPMPIEDLRAQVEEATGWARLVSSEDIIDAMRAAPDHLMPVLGLASKCAAAIELAQKAAKS